MPNGTYGWCERGYKLAPTRLKLLFLNIYVKIILKWYILKKGEKYMTGENLLISSVFLAGLLSFFAPCTFPLIPVYIGFMTDKSGEYRKLKIGKLEINKGGIIKTIAFVLGLSTSFVILGFGAGSIGRFLNNKYLLCHILEAGMSKL